MQEPSDPIQGLDSIESEVSRLGAVSSDKKEQKDLFGGGDGRRKEEAKQAIHVSFIWLLRVAAILFILVLVVRFLHFILPDTTSKSFVHGWLSDPQLQNIDKFFFSGALGALITRHLKQIIPE